MRLNFIVLRPDSVADGHSVGFRMVWNDRYNIYERFSNLISPSYEVLCFSPAGFNNIFKCINLCLLNVGLSFETLKTADFFFSHLVFSNKYILCISIFDKKKSAFK